MLFWRGWGVLVFIVPFAWIFVLIGVTIGMDYHEPDPGKVAVMIYRLGALAFALAAGGRHHGKPAIFVAPYSVRLLNGWCVSAVGNTSAAP